MTEALLLFVKNPRPGRVKTRLGRTLGDAEALRIYLLLLARTRQTALQTPADRLLFYSDFIDEQDDWDPAFFQKFLQSGPDLGERMYRAFETALQSHDACLLIGSDCPGITPELLRQAFDRLQQNDLILGPSTDGGYYLIGLHRPIRPLFEAIAWSTSKVLAQTLDKARKLDLSWHLLPELTDVDEAADWEQVKGELLK
jgi:rSAM/selenodomain-associated transferase 1